MSNYPINIDSGTLGVVNVKPGSPANFPTGTLTYNGAAPLTAAGTGVATALANPANRASGPVVFNSSTQYPADDGSLITKIHSATQSSTPSSTGSVTLSSTGL